MASTLTPAVRAGIAAQTGRVERLRILVLIQAVIAGTSAVEATIFSALGGGHPLPMFLTIGGTALTAWLAWRLRRPRRRTFRTVRRIQICWLLFGLIDLGLSLFLAQRGLSPVAVLTRFVLPIWIYVIARKESRRAMA